MGDALSIVRASDAVGDDFPGFSFQEDIEAVPEFDHLYRVKVTILFENGITVNDLTVATHIFRKAS